jgi:hypothetical protein
MTIEDIINYVLYTAGNTNPNILRGMLKKFQSGDNPDLSGITASADKILKGYKGVDRDGKEVVGTYEPLDTSDATATAETILKDYTAYVNGVKVTGTFEETGEEVCEEILENSYGTNL